GCSASGSWERRRAAPGRRGGRCGRASRCLFACRVLFLTWVTFLNTVRSTAVSKSIHHRDTGDTEVFDLDFSVLSVPPWWIHFLGSRRRHTFRNVLRSIRFS